LYLGKEYSRELVAQGFSKLAIGNSRAAASRAMLDEQHPLQPGIAGDDSTNVLRRILRHNAVRVCPPGQYGTNNAAIVATNLKRTFPSIRATLMVGIADGSPSQADLYLGDVVVGTRVMQYDGQGIRGRPLPRNSYSEDTYTTTELGRVHFAIAACRVRV
jgi:hypothetical protein